VTFGISDDDAEVTAAFRKKSQFVFERRLSAESIHETLKPADCKRLILRERKRYFRYPVSMICRSKTGRLGVIHFLDEHECELQVWLPESWTRRFRNWLRDNSNSRNSALNSK
jgi:hypothetical protein